jgi:hypothetical protein
MLGLVTILSLDTSNPELFLVKLTTPGTLFNWHDEVGRPASVPHWRMADELASGQLRLTDNGKALYEALLQVPATEGVLLQYSRESIQLTLDMEMFHYSYMDYLWQAIIAVKKAWDPNPLDLYEPTYGGGGYCAVTESSKPEFLVWLAAILQLHSSKATEEAMRHLCRVRALNRLSRQAQQCQARP